MRMSLYKKSTQVPNEVFDAHLKTLTPASLKVLLFILRRTTGQVDPSNKQLRVKRAWISQGLFARACNLSRRAVSNAIELLITDSLIDVTDRKGISMHTKEKRRGASRLYFASRLRLDSNLSRTSKPNCQKPVTNGNTIKLNRIKLSCYNSSQGVKRITDVQRFEQILNTQSSNNIKDTP